MEPMERELRDIFQQAAEGAAESAAMPDTLDTPDTSKTPEPPETPDYAGLLRRIEALEERLIQPEPEEQEEPEVQEPPKKPIPQNLPRFAAPIQGKAPEREEETVARRYKNNPWYKRFGA